MLDWATAEPELEAAPSAKTTATASDDLKFFMLINAAAVRDR